MKHNLTKVEVDDVIWWKCDDCDCTFRNKHWWVNGLRSKIEPECSADNLDWERTALKQAEYWE